MNVKIKEFQCAELLRPYIQSYWIGKFNLDSSKYFVQQVLPNGFVELIFHLSDKHCLLSQANVWCQSPDYTLIGLFTKPYEVRFDEPVSTFGIRFKPEGIYNLFGIPASEFSEDYMDMKCVFDKGFYSFSEKIREQSDIDTMISKADEYLLANFQSNCINYYYLNRAAEYIRKTDGMIRMEELVSNVYISHRQLEREFKEKLGISPKQYMRISRLNALNRKLITPHRQDLTALSYDVGFADQAHLIREFKQFAGLPPTKFLKQKRGFLVNV